MCALLWTAVSSKLQTEKDSLEQQAADATAYCRHKSWTVADTLTVPGQSREYIFFQEAEADMEACAHLRRHCQTRDVDVLVCRGRDRLGRTDALVAQCEALIGAAGARVLSLAMPTSGNTRADLYVSAIERAGSQSELLELRRRHEEGMDARAYRDLPVCGTLPFPYYRERNAEGKLCGPALLDSNGANALHEVLDLLRQGGSIHASAKLLNEKGFKFARGNPMNANSLHNILTNTFLAGYVTYHGRRRGNQQLGEPSYVMTPSEATVNQGQHKPVWTKEECDDLQALVVRRKRGHPSNGSAGIWQGILYCGKCGHTMPTKIFRRGGHIRIAYVCYRHRVFDCAKASYLPEARATAAVLPFLERWLGSPNTGPRPDPPAVPDIDKELAELDRREEVAFVAYEMGNINSQLYQKRRMVLVKERADLLEKVGQARENLALWKQTREKEKSLAEILPHLPQLLKETPRKELNRLLRIVMPALSIKDGVVIGLRS